VELVPESGSVFSIFIPSADEQTLEHEKKICAEETFNGKGKRVLVMDDEIYVRDVLDSMLVNLIDLVQVLKKCLQNRNNFSIIFALNFNLVSIYQSLFF